MLIIRRYYVTCKSRKIPASIQQNTSIGKFLQSTKKSCPRRNLVLGENFCRFALRITLYTDAVRSNKPFDSNLLHHQYAKAIGKLQLKDQRTCESSHLKLPSTGQLLSSTVFSSLDKWKHSAHEQVKNAYDDRSTSDEFISETVRGINYSLIGWYLQTYGMQNTLAFIQWLGVPLFSDPQRLSWSINSPLRNDTKNAAQSKLNQLVDGYGCLEQKIKYNFRDKSFLLQSVSHESFTANDLTASYNGMDFVGDAILNYAIVRHLFRQPMYLNADDLHRVSTLIYCNSSLATISVRNNIHNYLRYTAPDLRDNINSFVAFLRRNQFKPISDIHFLDKKNFVFEVPPIISDCFESIIAAVYFDSQMDLNAVTNSLVHLMHFDIRKICETKPKTAYDELEQLDPTAIFSKPVTEAAGKIKVSVKLPKFDDQCFSAYSRDPDLAKWGAAKAAVLQLKRQNNAFLPTTHKELLKHYESTQ